MEESKTVEALQALGHQTRLRIFRRLVEAGPGGMAAGALAEVVAVPSSTLSAHLTKLEHAGLVLGRRASRQVFYAVQIEPVRQLLGYLVEDCCQGRPELCGDLASARTTQCGDCD